MISNNHYKIKTVFGKYKLDNNFINWYSSNRDDIKQMFNNLINISLNNGIYIENNDINFNSFITMAYHESIHI